jgi:3D (Asp-Asp-Asp) domain-containing protein
MERTIKICAISILCTSIFWTCIFSAYGQAEAIGETTETISVVETTTEATTEETTDIPLTTVKAEDIPDYTDLGTFKLTAYCACSRCCGKSDGITASGKKATANHTVAADTSLIPFGTELMINGETYVVEDTGVRGMVIDIYFDSHEEAQGFGVKYAKVFEVC